jgi:hypothetical protein
MGFHKRASKSGLPGTGVLRGSSPGAEQAGAFFQIQITTVRTTLKGGLFMKFVRLNRGPSQNDNVSLNLAKSNFKLTPAPKSSVLRVQAWEDGLKVSLDTVDAQGNTLHPEAAYKFDGKHYPIKDSALADTFL